MLRFRLILLLLCLPLVVGCEGCRDDSADDQANQQKEAPKEDFTQSRTTAMPGDANVNRSGIKPGHWMSGVQTLKSNNADVRGDLVSRASAAQTTFTSGSGVTQNTDGMQSQRPIVLPKGQERKIEFRVLSPAVSSQNQARLFLSSRFLSAGRSTYFDTGRQPFSVMSGKEYFIVVLTKRPERFAAFQVANWIKPPKDEYDFKTAKPDYRLVIPSSDNVLPLPETMLDLTSTAVVFWDDMGSDALTPQQFTALADWVRFGGQLVVNGAAGSDEISKSPLADLLPLTPTSNIELDPDAAATMLQNWQVKTDRSTPAKIEGLREALNRIAVDGQLTDEATAVKDTGNLIVEKRFGLGRVVQPRFDLTEDWLQSWDSYDSFVNSVILLRPRRKTIESFNDDTEMRYSQEYVDLGLLDANAVMNTKFRLAARDSVLNTTNDGAQLATKQVNPVDKYYFSHPVTGVASWSDSSDAIRSCRDILKSESGIEIPESSLVVRSLGYYLLILVPINYLVFRLLGRLEYAWLAVPVIALGGALWVARAARLDIGFARSQTEIALLEIQPNYERAHLSRVVAIYNSLSSRYNFDFKTYDAAVKPIRDGNIADENNEFVFKTDYNEGPSLENFTVESNRIRMMHAEQVVDLGGTLDQQNGKVTNSTLYELFDVYVIKKSIDDEVEVASMGIFSPGSSREPKFQSLDRVSISDELPMQSARLLRKVASPLTMPPGTMRLVGRIDSSMPGMTVSPSTNQSSAQTIVLAHLQHAPMPEPKPDVNLITDLRKVITGKEGQTSNSTEE